MEFTTSPSGPSRSLPIAFALAAVLQIVIGSQLSVSGGSANFMLALVAALAIGGDPRLLTFLGFFAGLFFDLTSVVPIGLMSLLMTSVGFFTATASRGISGGLSSQNLLIALISIATVNVIYAVALFLLGVESNLLISLGVHALVSTALTALVAAVMLMLLPHAAPAHGNAARIGRKSTSFRAAPRSKGLRFKNSGFKGLG